MRFSINLYSIEYIPLLFSEIIGDVSLSGGGIVMEMV